MRTFFAIAILIWAVDVVIAGGGMEGTFDHVALSIPVVSTNATKSECASTTIERGYLERIDVVFGHSTSTPWMVMFSSNSFTHLTTTLLGSVIKATNFSLLPGTFYQDSGETKVCTNGCMKRIPLYNDRIYIIATNATPGATDQSIKAVVVYERK
ncbi:MAG: hypothetical protein PHW65_00055 [Dehalococcoidales bacterium]|nr:hypothetical protein [Dehalococcoidales bacterium]